MSERLDRLDAPTTEAGRALLAELSESPLPGARYAHHVVGLRIRAIEDEARRSLVAENTALREAAIVLRTTLVPVPPAAGRTGFLVAPGKGRAFEIAAADLVAALHREPVR